jgi:glycosyltransferase involved in cell wall biosynthesis
MNILLDVSPLENPKKTGIATYIDNLCRALLAEDTEDHFFLWGPDIRADPYPQFPRKTFQGNRLVSRSVQETVWRELGMGGVPASMDAYHLLFPAFPAPRKGRNTKFIATIYDLAFAYYPESITLAASFRYLAQCIPEQAEQADAITTISQSAKNDIRDILAVPEEKIAVIYPGVDLRRPTEEEMRQAEQLPEFAELNLPARYILCLGTWEPRKNLPTLFRALHRLRAKLIGADTYLCMSGIKGHQYAEAESLIRELGLEDRIVTLGYVPREWLPILYARARMFVYPSMYEGFGMPVVEAMVCGTPVVTSNVSSLPEAAGDAGLLVAPNSSEAFADAIERLLDDDALRQEMIRKGFEHARQFSWQNAARAHIALYTGKANPPSAGR